MKLKKFFLLTTSMLVLSNSAVGIIQGESLPWTAQAQEQQVSDLVSLGQSLTNQQQKETLILLDQRQGNKNKYVYVDQALVDYIAQEDAVEQDAFYLSAAINPEFAQKGVAVDIVTPENILDLDATAYRNAFITAGVRNMSVQLASVEPVEGVNGVVGVFEALNENGFSLDPSNMRAAYLELKTVVALSEGTDVTFDEINDWMMDLKVQLIDQQFNESSGDESVTELFIQDHTIEDDLAVQRLYEFTQAFTQAPASQTEETKEALLNALTTPDHDTIQIEGQTAFATLQDFINFYEQAMVTNKVADESGISNDQYDVTTWRLDKVFTEGFEASYLHPTSNKRQKVEVKILDNDRIQMNESIYELQSGKRVDEVKESTSTILPSTNRPTTEPSEETSSTEQDQDPASSVENSEEDETAEDNGDEEQATEVDPTEEVATDLPMEEVVLEGGFDWDTLADVADYYQRVMSYNYGFTPDVSDWQLSSIDGITINTYPASHTDEAVSFTTYDDNVTITWANGQWISVDNDTLEIVDQSEGVNPPQETQQTAEAQNEEMDNSIEEDEVEEVTLSIDATEVIWDLQYMYDTYGLSGYDFVLNNDLEDWQVLEESNNSVLLGSLDGDLEINQFVQVTLNGSEYTIEIYEADPATNSPAAVWKYNPSNGHFES